MAIVVIVLVVVVAGAFIWRGTGKKKMTADQMSQMKQIMEERGMGLAAKRDATAARPGASTQWAAPQPQSGTR